MQQLDLFIREGATILCAYDVCTGKAQEQFSFQGKYFCSEACQNSHIILADILHPAPCSKDTHENKAPVHIATHDV